MTIERWKTFSKRDQLLHTGAEFERARVCEQENNPEGRALALGQALELINLSLRDPKWGSERVMLEGLQSEVARFQDKNPQGVGLLYQML